MIDYILKKKKIIQSSKLGINSVKIETKCFLDRG